MPMAKPVVIRTPLPSPDEVAAKLGISKKRVRELRKLIGVHPKRVKIKSADSTRSNKARILSR
jgi:hypothetical protein